MNKNIKRIIALALVFGTFSTVAPVTNFNLLISKAYAAEDNTYDTLDSLKLLTSGGSNIRLYSDDGYDSSDKVDSDEVTDGEKYYGRTSSKTINIDTDGPSTRYIKVFKGTSSSTRGRSVSDDITLSSGTNTLVVRVYSSKPDTDIRYDDDSDVVSEYTIKVKYTGADESAATEDSAEDYDEVYLDKLSVDYENITLSQSKVLYTYNVANNIDKVTIKAVPEDDNYTVRVNDSKVYEDENYKTKVSLKTGVNQIKIEVEDEDNNDYRIYTLNITRENAANTTPTANNFNQWVKENGVWKYYDSLGNLLKDSLFYDRNYGKTYYLQSDGSMLVGWLNLNGKWYYFGQDGAMLSGWIINNGKYYYLYSDGSMAFNTKIGLYKLGTDGAWIR
jgi:FOG: Glucan-binding domain (YG repeat)